MNNNKTLKSTDCHWNYIFPKLKFSEHGECRELALWAIVTRGQKSLNFPLTHHRSWFPGHDNTFPPLPSLLDLWASANSWIVPQQYISCLSQIHFHEMSLKGNFISKRRGSEMPQWHQPDLRGSAWEHSPVPAQISAVIRTTEGACPFADPWTRPGIQKDLEFYFLVSHRGFNHQKIIQNLAA